MNQINDDTNEEQTLTKKERNELKREEKQKEREKRIRMKKIKSILPWAIFLAVVAGGIYWVAVTAEKNEESRPGEEIPIMGRDHINVGDPHEPYNSNPPTSGPHAGPLP